ncbi:SDR family oxidoreductase [Herbaspirillum lusitanum]|uniref:SDR family oxidoreductase n=1 Tax=Herbaspirillum lusitanum TaxID=213312 RepID=A0ABW9AAP0_9BURK
MTDIAKTVVITGSSSGIGKATAQVFARAGWNVVAAMRLPAVEKDLVETDRLKLVALDVQDAASVTAAVATSISAFSKIDVWINNAGYGTFGPIEAASQAQVQRQYDVNVFGVIHCVKAIAPHFRSNREGVIINVSSIGGLMALPAYTLYNSTKFAVEGLSEGLWYELSRFGIRVKIVEPGLTKTNFGSSSMDLLDHSELPAYEQMMEAINAARKDNVSRSSSPELVANTIFEAANDPGDRLRYLVGADAKRLWRLRRWIGAQTQMRIVRRALKMS